MARNGAGTFAVLNPIIVGAPRSSSAVNENCEDAGDEITNSLPLDGSAAMSGQIRAVDGSVLAPGIAFSTDTNTGFRRSGTDESRWVSGGQDRATMSAQGKLTLAGALNVTGALSHEDGAFGSQTLVGTGAARATLRRIENDTDEHELVSYESGSGAGAKGSLRVVGGGSNDVATMRFYVNDVKAFEWTSTLFTHAVDTLFGASGIRGDADGFLDFPELSAAPSVPSANIARLYAKDNGSSSTKLYYKDASGNERDVSPPLDRQTFSSSSTWTKPTAGQSTALIELWSGGGSGGAGDAGAGGGGGSYARRVIALASLSSSVSVTVGSGGSSQTGEGDGSNGGSSSFGSYLSAFGGAGGSGTSSSSRHATGSGGGGLVSAGSVGVAVTADSAGGDGGLNRGFLASLEWGKAINSEKGNSNPFGGAAGGGASVFAASDGAEAFWGGGGGGADNDGFGSPGNGGSSVYGGGGGGAGAGSTSGGVSILGGGNGGAGTFNSNAIAGTVPAGGGGGAVAGDSGAGARGEVRITCW